jgi:hypothetical protein
MDDISCMVMRRFLVVILRLAVMAAIKAVFANGSQTLRVATGCGYHVYTMRVKWESGGEEQEG